MPEVQVRKRLISVEKIFTKVDRSLQSPCVELRRLL